MRGRAWLASLVLVAAACTDLQIIERAPRPSGAGTEIILLGKRSEEMPLHAYVVDPAPNSTFPSVDLKDMDRIEALFLKPSPEQFGIAAGKFDPNRGSTATYIEHWHRSLDEANADWTEGSIWASTVRLLPTRGPDECWASGSCFANGACGPCPILEIGVPSGAIIATSTCPAGWHRETTRPVPFCKPWADGPPMCPANETSFPGDSVCDPLGQVCGPICSDLVPGAVYVSAAASGSGSGTCNDPLSTIGQALGVVAPGGTVIVDQGSHVLGQPIDQPVTIRGACAANTIIEETAEVESMVTLQQLTLRRGLVVGATAVAALDDVIIENDEAVAIDVGGRLDIDGLLIRGTASTGMLVTVGAAVVADRIHVGPLVRRGIVAIGGRLALRNSVFLAAERSLLATESAMISVDSTAFFDGESTRITARLGGNVVLSDVYIYGAPRAIDLNAVHATIAELWLERVEGDELVVRGDASVTVTDIVSIDGVAGVESNATSIRTIDGPMLQVERWSIVSSAKAALRVGNGSANVTVTDLSCLDLETTEPAIEIQPNIASFTLNRAIFAEAPQAILSRALNPGISVSDLLVKRSQSQRAATCSQSAAIDITEGEILRAKIGATNRPAFVVGSGTVIVTSMDAQRTSVDNCAVGEAVRVSGLGVLEMQEFRIAYDAGTALEITNETVGLQEGVIENSALGVRLHRDGLAPFPLLDNVLFTGNDKNVSVD